VNIKKIIILLSLLLVISPVSVAYSSLMADSESEQTSHCEQSEKKQLDKSCCQVDQCDNQCQSMQCNHFVKISALSPDAGYKSFLDLFSYTSSYQVTGPDEGLLNTPLRPPISTL
jgi:hypothetical protein